MDTDRGMAVLATLVAFFAWMLLASLWWPLGVFAPLLVIGVALWQLPNAKKAAQREAERQVAERADREHEQLMHGDVRGIFGEWMPPEELQGVGLWLCGEDNERGNDPPRVQDVLHGGERLEPLPEGRPAREGEPGAPDG